MTFEHFAINVSKPVEMGKWYVDNCEMKIVRSMDNYPYTRFLTDKAGKVMMEIYSNTSARILDFKNQHPLEFHFALTVDDPVKVKEKLMSAGATYEEEVRMDDGSHLIMLRDPFGIPLQLCKRGKPMI
jgi:catechol 2,3-dioxygenase-like lactoylglutathione lyase family enzyme